MNELILGADSPQWLQFVPLILLMGMFAAGGLAAWFAIRAGRKRQSTPPPVPKIPTNVSRVDNAAKHHGGDV